MTKWQIQWIYFILKFIHVYIYGLIHIQTCFLCRSSCCRRTLTTHWAQNINVYRNTYLQRKNLETELSEHTHTYVQLLKYSKRACHLFYSSSNMTLTHTHTHTHTHPFNGPFPGLPRWAGTRKVKPIWILLKQETVPIWLYCNFTRCVWY